MTTQQPVPAATFAILSDLPEAGEDYSHEVIVEQSGRTLTVVQCTWTETTEQAWTSRTVPRPSDLADLLVRACHDDHHQLRIRVLSAVVHGLLPTGDYTEATTTSIPDSVFDDALGYGPLTTYRAAVSDAVLAALRTHEALAWGLRIQERGADERDELLQQLTAPENQTWLRETLARAGMTHSRPFDALIAQLITEG